MTEHQIQVAVFNWARYMEHKYPELRLMFAVPNGGHRHILVARRLKLEGVRRGVPDIFLPCARQGYHGLFLEIKRPGGRVSAAQKETLAMLRAAGYKTTVAYGVDEAIAIIEQYLKS